MAHHNKASNRAGLRGFGFSEKVNFCVNVAIVLQLINLFVCIFHLYPFTSLNLG
jgi:hypothetical protein